MPTPLRGIEALLEVLHAGGVRYIFGNPGTTELPFNDALVNDPRFEYILALQEVPLVAMADGYALASGKLGVACVHIACGLGNAMGMLYNAHIEGSPLMLIAGQQDRRLRLGEPVLEGDLVGVVRPWTKWAVEVQRVEDVPAAVRRAAQIAQTPATGPVFLSLPVDVQMEAAGEMDLSAPSIPDRRVRPPMEALSRAANMLAQAQRPVILAGSRVTECGGCEALAEAAERLGAPIYAECATSHGRLPVSAAHPLYAGTLPLWIPDVRKILEQHDVVFVAGMNFLRLYLHHEPGNPVPPGVRIIHLDCNPGEIGKNFPVEIGLVGDLQAGLAELAGLVESRLDETRRKASATAIEQGAQRRKEMQSQLWAEIDAQRDAQPMSPLALMGALARALPPGTAVVDEAVTTNQNVLERLGVMVEPALHIAHRGWALGWGLGCALGVKLAWPERPVLGLLGDGATLYGVQGLWTAAHHRIPAVFVVCNNREYKILKNCGDVMPLPEMAAKNYLAMDLVGPEIDFVGLSRSFGVEAHRVTSVDELEDRVRTGLAGDQPVLLEVPIS